MIVCSLHVPLRFGGETVGSARGPGADLDDDITLVAIRENEVLIRINHGGLPGADMALRFLLEILIGPSL
jgi:hypothetical protein